jgi:plastocyanin
VIIIVIAIATIAFRPSPEPSQITDLPATQTASVDITYDSFLPQTIKISVGTSVTWTNKTDKGVRIAAEPYPTGDSLPELDSEDPLGPNETYAFTFDKPGTYNYYDFDNYEKIKGTVIVE